MSLDVWRLVVCPNCRAKEAVEVSNYGFHREREGAQPGVWELFCRSIRVEARRCLLRDRDRRIGSVRRAGGENFSNAAVVRFFAMAICEQRDGETSAGVGREFLGARGSLRGRALL